MTEAKWNVCNDPVAMLQVMVIPDRASKRKIRLFGVACCRMIWHLLIDERTRKAVEVAESYADGHASSEELASVQSEIHAAVEVFGRDVQVINGVPLEALRTVYHTLWGGTWEVSKSAARPAWETRRKKQAAVIREVFGPLPFRPVSLDPAWLTSTVTQLAESIYQDRAFDTMPILADALEDAGCTNADILNHCRQPGEHVRGCWVNDLQTGRK